MLSKSKKIICVILIFVFCLSFTAFAENTVSLTLPEGFLTYEKSPEKVAQAIGMEQTELKEYCTNNNILYLAVDKNNSRQIRATVSKNEFSNKIVNISELTDDKISSLAPDIAGIDGVRGSVVKINGQKFLKIQLKSEDSGGEYILTQYITVTKRQNLVLSFYNNADVNTDYINEVFNSLDSTLLEDTALDDSDTENEKINLFLIIIPIITIAFLLICIALGISLVIEIKRNRYEDEDEESILESFEEKETDVNDSPTTDSENN